MPTQDEYNVSKQAVREIDIKVYLLNYAMQMVDELSGVVIGNPSFDISATSDIRRTCGISLIPVNSSFDIKEGNKIWIDKFIKIEVAIKDIRTDEMVWTNMGIYLINNPNRVYNATSNIMTIEGLDLMAKLTGLRNGNLEGMTYIINAGENVRSAIIDTLAFAGFTQYVCEECPYSVPNDIRIDMGGTVYDILSELRDIIPQYQIYFDVDGVFHYEEMPTGKNEQIVADDDIFGNLNVEYQVNTDFENVKNVIEVYGKTHDIAYYSGTTISGSIYIATIAEITSLWDDLKIGFTAPSKVTNPYINLNSYGALPLKNEDGTFAVLNDDTDVYYVAKYQSSGNYWLFMGTVTPYAMVEETNPDSPFYVNGTSGRIRKVFNGGNYDNIYMSSLAMERARWELYNYCRLQDNITLSCVSIYWLDVNQLIEITLKGTTEKNKYIIKQISTEFGTTGLQTITAMKYYPYYDTE